MSAPSAGIVRTTLLFVWAAFLGWLLVSGEVYRYIGPRTMWVVIFGAVMLMLAALMQIGSGSAERLSQKELLGLSSFIAPIAILVLVPSAGLGSEAASRKSSGGLVSAASRFAPVPQSGGDVSFPEISYASDSEEYGAALGIVDGYELKLTGFVTHPDDTPDGTFALTRFATFCCAADAIPYSVTVDPSITEDYPDDTWLTVSGSLARRTDELVLEAERITEVKEPKNPYI